MYRQCDLVKELTQKQLSDIPNDKKLCHSDIRRICKYINNSIFDAKQCCIWNGYITNENNISKGTYINFYFNNKKMALHRLLYINFVDNLTNEYYLKFTCSNKGKCCNVNHIKRFRYKKMKKKKKS